MASIWIVIPAAGVGSRFQPSTLSEYKPKQYHLLLDKTVLEQTIRRFSCHDDIKGIVLAVAKNDLWIDDLPLNENTLCVEGGRTRAESVLNAINHVLTFADTNDKVAVHDAARPCVSKAVLTSLFDLANEVDHGVVAALPIVDTVKQVNNGKIVSTIDRSHIYLAHTPQIFPALMLKTCIEKAMADGVLVTDEASAVEHCGYHPHIVESNIENIKITTPTDLDLASHYLACILQEEAICE